MKYRVVGTTLKRNGKRYAEGSIIELSADDAKALDKFLKPIEEVKDEKEGKKTKKQKG